ncbi:hypothetical protein QE152_g8374 [Popillia japonica]|uniref:G-protein coupled receptors family 1 profile domain-containing protein n=1 Tax=Popillia japonica TaxID=7064 RepID=A0AAW1MB71_POPJA
MLVLPEIIILSTGIVGVITSIILLLVILISGRRTSTHIYIMDVAVTMILQQFVSPVFHSFYVSNKYYEEFDVRIFLSLVYFVLLSGMLAMLILIFLMDYFRWITNFKWTVILVHFVVSIVLTIFYYFVIEQVPFLTYIIVFLVLIQFLGFLLLYFIHYDLESLNRRKETDDESRLRHVLIMMFFCTKVAATIIFVVENFLGIVLIGWPTFGFFALGFYQLDSIFFLIVLFKVDHRFRTSFIEFFKMCSCKRSAKIQFQTLSNDNGRLINQDV